MEPQTSFYENLKGAILAGKRSKFVPRWSTYVSAWLKRASLVIRFEDLIAEPIETIETLRSVIDLPDPDASKLPSFQDLRSKRMKYGNVAEKRSREEQDAHRKKFFRKGKTGAWKEEMPEDLHELFWVYNGATMDKLGYQEGRIAVPYTRSMRIKAKNTLKHA